MPREMVPTNLDIKFPTFFTYQIEIRFFGINLMYYSRKRKKAQGVYKKRGTKGYGIANT
ncbi:hypothetical protein CE91St36_13850 [Christensenellaceae bacterium]|nr:hypothetical protein CE91St36_13850 [Christensenellaceae bacterium]BDF61236.1 hypothetical protein CE91St37_13860 [Christensenellaceae bacterium]